MQLISDGLRLAESLPIPCLASTDAAKWEYKLPKNIPYSFWANFECPQLSDVVLLNKSKMALFLNESANVRQPVSGSYKSAIIVAN
jgi:hypothetical protein